MDGESSLGVVDQTEVLPGLLDCDNVHKSGRVGRVCADLSVDLDEALHDDRLDFTGWVLAQVWGRGRRRGGEVPGVQGVLQPVADEDDKWQTVPQLVRTW